MMITQALEFIWHFTCTECKGWWSIASMDHWKPRELYCPHCGVKKDYSDTEDNKQE